MLSKHERASNAAAAIDQQFAAEMLCSLKDTLAPMHTPLQPTASFALEMIIGDFATDSGHIEYWIPSNTYYAQLWMTQCELEDIVSAVVVLVVVASCL